MKCKKCGAPISGFLSKIAWLAGVKSSVIKEGYCNKCDREVDVVEVAQPVAPTVTQPKDLFESAEVGKVADAPVGSVAPEVPVAPVAPVPPLHPSEPKDIFDSVGK